jgi:hypothetical protein
METVHKQRLCGRRWQTPTPDQLREAECDEIVPNRVVVILLPDWQDGLAHNPFAATLRSRRS